MSLVRLCYCTLCLNKGQVELNIGGTALRSLEDFRQQGYLWRTPSYTSAQSFVSHGEESDQVPLVRTESGNDETTTKPGPSSTTTEKQLASKPRANRERKRKWKSWRFGVMAAAASTFLVMILNLSLLAWSAVKSSGQDPDPETQGIFTAYEGDCQVVTRLSIGLHLVINVLGSMMLGASNYTMQCLTAPTREEADKAHREGRWLDIGVASIRNLFRIKWPKTALWFVLGLTSVPIHLLYNSAVFKRTTTDAYAITTVHEDFFLQRHPLGNWTLFDYGTNRFLDEFHPDATRQVSAQDVRIIRSMFTENDAYDNSSVVENLTAPHDCISRYHNRFLSGRSHVLAVTKEKGDIAEQTVFGYEEPQTGYDWICIDDSNAYACDPSEILSSSEPWTVHEKKIDYCLSRLVDGSCKLQFSETIFVVVIVCNAAKVVAMLTALWVGKTPALVTLGDAVASYLERPDKLTVGHCTFSKREAVAHLRSQHQPPGHVHDFRGLGPAGVERRTLHPSRTEYVVPSFSNRWWNAASAPRWLTTVGLCILALAIASELLRQGARELGRGAQRVFESDFGETNLDLIVKTEHALPQRGAAAILVHVLVVNLPQVVVSFLYLLYNGLLTSMLVAHEWSTYAVTRKGLRVSIEHGMQRRTYWLQLPYKYGLPLVVAMMLLHWFISQAIFLIRLDTVSYGDFMTGVPTGPTENITAAGYNPPAIFGSIMMGLCMLLMLVALGFRKFASTMPVAGSCSFAIAAACHPPANDPDAAFLPVQWGVVKQDETAEDEVGHCSFTSKEVSELVPGRKYA
ncbi:hypothetical protein MBLNU230_g8284t1 [Neophaeotheca triangularis]